MPSAPRSTTPATRSRPCADSVPTGNYYSASLSPVAEGGHLRRRTIGLFAVSIVVAATVAWAASTQSSTKTVSERGVRARFAYLSSQHTNFCGLAAHTVLGYPDAKHLQGSCCNPMDLTKYRSQVMALRRYAAIAEVPTDPYDIRADQAK